MTPRRRQQNRDATIKSLDAWQMNTTYE